MAKSQMCKCGAVLWGNGIWLHTCPKPKPKPKGGK
jgi:hypothetical protein